MTEDITQNKRSYIENINKGSVVENKESQDHVEQVADKPSQNISTGEIKKGSFHITSIKFNFNPDEDDDDDSLDESLDTSRKPLIIDSRNITQNGIVDCVTLRAHETGIAPVIPTSPQYGLALVSDSKSTSEDVKGDVTAPKIEPVATKLTPNLKNDNSTRVNWNERFRVVKIESTEPFKRGRWTCMDYSDHSMVQRSLKSSLMSSRDNSSVQSGSSDRIIFRSSDCQENRIISKDMEDTKAQLDDGVQSIENDRVEHQGATQSENKQCSPLQELPPSSEVSTQHPVNTNIQNGSTIVPSQCSNLPSPADTGVCLPGQNSVNQNVSRTVSVQSQPISRVLPSQNKQMYATESNNQPQSLPPSQFHGVTEDSERLKGLNNTVQQTQYYPLSQPLSPTGTYCQQQWSVDQSNDQCGMIHSQQYIQDQGPYQPSVNQMRTQITSDQVHRMPNGQEMSLNYMRTLQQPPPIQGQVNYYCNTVPQQIVHNAQDIQMMQQNLIQQRQQTNRGVSQPAAHIVPQQLIPNDQPPQQTQVMPTQTQQFFTQSVPNTQQPQYSELVPNSDNVNLPSQQSAGQSNQYQMLLDLIQRAQQMDFQDTQTKQTEKSETTTQLVQREDEQQSTQNLIDQLYNVVQQHMVADDQQHSCTPLQQPLKIEVQPNSHYGTEQLVQQGSSQTDIKHQILVENQQIEQPPQTTYTQPKQDTLISQPLQQHPPLLQMSVNPQQLMQALLAGQQPLQQHQLQQGTTNQLFEQQLPASMAALLQQVPISQIIPQQNPQQFHNQTFIQQQLHQLLPQAPQPIPQQQLYSQPTGQSSQLIDSQMHSYPRQVIHSHPNLEQPQQPQPTIQNMYPQKVDQQQQQLLQTQNVAMSISQTDQQIPIQQAQPVKTFIDHQQQLPPGQQLQQTMQLPQTVLTDQQQLQQQPLQIEQPLSPPAVQQTQQHYSQHSQVEHQQFPSNITQLSQQQNIQQVTVESKDSEQQRHLQAGHLPQLQQQTQSLTHSQVTSMQQLDQLSAQQPHQQLDPQATAQVSQTHQQQSTQGQLIQQQQPMTTQAQIVQPLQNTSQQTQFSSLPSSQCQAQQRLAHAQSPQHSPKVSYQRNDSQQPQLAHTFQPISQPHYINQVPQHYVQQPSGKQNIVEKLEAYSQRQSPQDLHNMTSRVPPSQPTQYTQSYHPQASVQQSASGSRGHEQHYIPGVAPVQGTPYYTTKSLPHPFQQEQYFYSRLPSDMHPCVPCSCLQSSRESLASNESSSFVAPGLTAVRQMPLPPSVQRSVQMQPSYCNQTQQRTSSSVQCDALNENNDIITNQPPSSIPQKTSLSSASNQQIPTSISGQQFKYPTTRSAGQSLDQPIPMQSQQFTYQANGQISECPSSSASQRGISQRIISEVDCATCSQIDNNDGSNNAVAIDNKIEQAMDLVKKHLLFAVREEVEILKEKITELMDKIQQLENENSILKANIPQETLSELIVKMPNQSSSTTSSSQHAPPPS